MIKRAVLALTLSVGAAQADDAALMDFFETQACGIGPSSRANAVAAGFDLKTIGTWEKHLLVVGEARMDGGWIVLSPEFCTIRLPDFDSPFAMDGPVVAAAIGAVDEYAAPSDITGSSFPGCYLDGEKIQDALVDQGDVTAAYLRFVAAGLGSGDLRFYSENILETPPGFQVTRGMGCDSVPNIGALQESHDVLLARLDEFVRAVGPLNACDDSYWPNNGTDVYDVIAPFYDSQTNAHFTIEILFMAMAAGWIEGAGDAGRGTPRPPLCTYE